MFTRILEHTVRLLGVAMCGIIAVIFLLHACSCATRPVAPPAKPDGYINDLSRRMYQSSIRIEVDCEEGTSWGTGWAISPRHLITAMHVVDCETGKPPEMITAHLYNGTDVPVEIDATVKGVDAVRLIVLDPEPTMHYFPIYVPSTYSKPDIGEEVCVVAGTLRGVQAIKKCGAVAMHTDEFFIVSIHVVPGNSGGAVFNSKGQVVGLVRAGAWESSGEFLGLFVPTAKYVRLLDLTYKG